MQLPEVFLNSLEGTPGFDRTAFVLAHQVPSTYVSVRINPFKQPGTKLVFPNFSHITFENVPWSKYGYYLSERPSFTFDPFFHAGLYYVQEASSMFLEQALTQLADLSQPLKILDLSAAPGGKATHIQSLISNDSLLVANEVIKSRCAVLTDNIIKWGSGNVVITNNDPSAFKNLTGYFDVIVVDAPCSGSGLFRKDKEAINEWSLNNVSLCSQRQQRILADVMPALKDDGILIYSTCSYSKEEDEAIGEWLVQEFEFKSETLKIPSTWGIVESKSKHSTGYRFYPDKLKGEGFFLSCFRKQTTERETKFKPVPVEKASATEKDLIRPWLRNGALELIREDGNLTAVSTALLENYLQLKPVLKIFYKGTVIGQVMKNKLVPHHALAVSTLLLENAPSVEVAYEEAIKFLQRQELQIQPPTQGWQIVRYKNQGLGWINALPNRINNYYPKEMRILKQSL